jgi:hypothetical protein
LVKAAFQELEEAQVAIADSDLPSPVVSSLGPRNWWRLVEVYRYTDGAYTITVPAGFEFNMASVPRVFWGLIGPFELSVAAPLVHDFLYRYRGALPLGTVDPKREYTRRQADQLFRTMMEKEAVSWWRRPPAYLAVRIFGGFVWKRSRPALEMSASGMAG